MSKQTTSSIAYGYTDHFFSGNSEEDFKNISFTAPLPKQGQAVLWPFFFFIFL